MGLGSAMRLLLECLCNVSLLSLPRETLLGQLTGYIRSIRDDFTSKSPVSPRHKRGDPASAAVAEQQAPPTGKNMPDVVNNVVWTRQLEAKVHV